MYRFCSEFHIYQLFRSNLTILRFCLKFRLTKVSCVRFFLSYAVLITFSFVKSSIPDTLFQLYRESRFFDRRDLLVNLSKNQQKITQTSEVLAEINLSEVKPRILAEAKSLIRESGTNPLCWALTKVQSDSDEDVNFPLFLIPTSFDVNSITNTIQFDNREELLINPYLSVFLDKKEVALKEEFAKLLSHGFVSTETKTAVEAYVESVGLVLNKAYFALGNFHPHRFDHLRDLDQLMRATEYSSALNQLLGEEVRIEEPINLSNRLLYPADLDHLNCFEQFKKSNLSLIGPPGTGKSQFISNLIGKCLFDKHSLLVVSEKRTALEVLKRKLSEHDLDRFLFINTHKNDKQEFVAQLKKNWNYLESFQIAKKKRLQLSTQHRAHLQLLLDILNTPILDSGFSISDFLKVSQGKHSDGNYRLNPPDIEEFQRLRGALITFYDEKDHSVIANIPVSAIKEKSAAEYLNEILRIKEEFEHLTTVVALKSKLDVEQAMRRLSRAQVVSNELVKKHHLIFKPGTRENKTFLKLSKKYKTLKNELNTIQLPTHWKRNPHKIELTNLDTLFKAKGLNWKTRRTWRKLSEAPVESAIELIRDQLQILQKKELYQAILNEFCGISISDPETEVDSLFRTFELLAPEEWQDLEQLRSELDLLPSGIHGQLESLWKSLNRHLNCSETQDLRAVLDTISNNSAYLTEKWRDLQSYSPDVLRFIQSSDCFDTFEADLMHTHWLNFISRFPALQGYNSSMLSKKLVEIEEEQRQEYAEFSIDIVERLASHFQAMESLLQIPARKLNEEQKTQKAKLRKGKAILVKEFSKKTRFSSIYELLNSDASEWITSLLPVLLCNGGQAARSIPLTCNLFDVALFDESSQTPLFNAVGSVQRAKRILIAGDDQQMGPESSFSGISSQAGDLLTQGLYYLQRGELHHHYRSYSTDLISFSNKHFYKDQLIAFPSYPINEQSIQFHYCEGLYIERTNKCEATEIAKQIKKLLAGNCNFGVVAFSEEQLNCIYKMLDGKSQKVLEERIQENNAFFKPIEKVQGDECDTLLISFTFGYNEDGLFRHNFGPMSTASGRNRLNVLLTRARYSIHFYASVRSVDFKISSNESISLIRKWFRFVEGEDNYAKSVVFPYGVSAVTEENKVKVQQIEKYLPHADEFITFHQVMGSRGWSLIFD
jgi:hypothetical protein